MFSIIIASHIEGLLRRIILFWISNKRPKKLAFLVLKSKIEDIKDNNDAQVLLAKISLFPFVLNGVCTTCRVCTLWPMLTLHWKREEKSNLEIFLSKTCIPLQLIVAIHEVDTVQQHNKILVVFRK